MFGGTQLEALRAILAIPVLASIVGVIRPFPPFAKRWQWATVLGFSAIVLSTLSGPQQPFGPPPASTTASSKAPAATPAGSEASAANQSSTASTTSDQKARYIAQLHREVASLERGFNIAPYLDSKDNVMMGLVLFSAWATIYEEGKKYELSDEDEALRRKLRNLVLAAQQKALPRLRKAWSQALNKSLWEVDITASALGGRSETLELVGAIYAANANKRSSMKELWEALMLLRFKRIQFKWFKYEDEFTYWQVPSPTDKDLIVWENSTPRKVE